ncbi:hypothetical protein GCM10022204_27050 [Microlunatus aurantiacus]|uniref:Colicin import membrane protein n=1 Tax=Microlunatus aurantiacus TaxID=446786 RepID=A0ABP7DQG2_9ACTN
MAEESDGIEEALESTMRLSATAAARLGTEIARAHEDRLREQRRLDVRETERLARRYEVESQAELGDLGRIRRTDSRERADAARTPSEITQAEEWIKSTDREAWDRYQRDLMGCDSAEARAVEYRHLIHSWRQTQGPDTEALADENRRLSQEQTEAAAMLAAAAREDRQADAAREDERNAEAERLYDSADRRAADAAAMTATGIDPQVAESRMHADTAAGVPATAATTGGRRGRAPKARTTRGRGSQAQRAGVER